MKIQIMWYGSMVKSPCSYTYGLCNCYVMRAFILLAILVGLVAAALPPPLVPSPPAVCQPSSHPIECYVVPGDGDYTDPKPSGADYNMCLTFGVVGEPGVRYQGLSYGLCTSFFQNATLVRQLSSYTLCNTALCNSPRSSSSAMKVGSVMALGVAVLASIF